MSGGSAPPISFPLRAHWLLLALWMSVTGLIVGLCISLAVSMPYYTWVAALLGLASLFWFRDVLHNVRRLNSGSLHVDTVGNITIITGSESQFAECVSARVYGCVLIHLRLRTGSAMRHLALLTWTDAAAHRLLRQRINNDNLTSPLVAMSETTPADQGRRFSTKE